MSKSTHAWRWTAQLVSVALALTACSSPPPRYYSLAQRPQSSGSALRTVDARQQRIRIEVMPVVVPERFNRRNLLLNDADGTLKVLEQERWLVPFPDELRDAMSQRLQAELPAIDTYHQGIAGVGPCYRISIELVQLDTEPGHSVAAVFNWRVQALPDGAPVLGQTTLELPLSATMQSVVTAYQKLVAELSADVALQVRELQR